jgi:hypothetical protein
MGGKACQSDGMGFFDSIQRPPPPEPARTRRPAWMRSDAVIPGLVPAEVVLVRTGQVAVAIGGVRAYPNGFEFTIHVRLRREDESGSARGGLFERPGRRMREPNEALRLGVMFADGRRAATPGGHPRPGDSDAGQLVLFENGGGGSSRTWDGNFWVHPLPPEGPVTFVVSWPEHGVAEARAELDGAAIGAAARRALILWSEEPESEPDDGYAWRSQVVSAGEPEDPGSRAEPDQPGADAPGPDDRSRS